MDRRGLLGFLAAGAATLGITGQAEGHETTAGDDAAIRAVIHAYQASWNASDLDAMGALYRPEIHWVNVKGMHWRGFPEVDRAHRVYFDVMFRGVRQDLEAVESITTVAPGVAIAVVKWRHGAFRTPSGHQSPELHTRMTLVMTKAADGWKIVQGCNIEIDEQAAQFDPIRGAAMQGPPPGH